ncbi:MAG: metal-dependent hydrolase [Betaproteobacteria bacterium]|nr:metal-dependent hydrolase [Betaproteobacteria bacterium]
MNGVARFAAVLAVSLLGSCASNQAAQPAQTTPAAQPVQSAQAAQPAQAATPAAAPQPGKLEVLWLGHSAFRIVTPGGKVIVIDPWLRTNPSTPAAYRDLRALGKVDLLLVTHGHSDHVADAPELARINRARIYSPAGLGATLITLGEIAAELAPGMNKGGEVMPLGPGIKLHMVHAEHSSEYRHKNPISGREENYPAGEPVGWIIELENGFKIYYTGDTGLFGDMKLIGEFYKPDLLLLPIGGVFTMNPELAAYAVREMIKPKFAIPMHYGTYPNLAGKPEDFVKALGDGPTKAIVLQPGEKVTF